MPDPQVFDMLGGAMGERHGPLEELLRAIDRGDLGGARTAAEALGKSLGADPAQLAAEVLHELRQPLFGIKGYLQMMEEDQSQTGTPLPLLLGQVERMEQIIADYLRLASREAAPKERLLLDVPVRAALAAFEAQPASARLRIDAELEPGLEIDGNGRLLEQLVLNLLGNAREAMGGRGRVKVLTGREGGAPVLLIADWGPGISPELRERVFEPYVTSRAYGTGLGLAVCKRIAAEHDAEIAVVEPRSIGDQPPPATVFRVRFPPTTAPRQSAKKRLLVVDDEAIICGIFSDLMGRECEVVTASSGEIALDTLRLTRTPFDLIITDKNLPGLSGLELAARARELDPDSRVIIMTGYPSEVTAQQALDLGVVDYLLKPFDDIRAVRETIRQTLAEPPKRSRPSPAARGTTQMRVDVFEDDPRTAEAIAQAITLLGMVPRLHRTSGEPTGDTPDAVVVSFDFGPSPGAEALKMARRVAGDAPVVVLVEQLSMETTLQVLRAGCTACLPKSLTDPRALSRELARALRVLTE